MLIILAGLQKIGDSLYEAASIDGRQRLAAVLENNPAVFKTDDFDYDRLYGG